jgi:hypothetical protein
MVKSVYKTYVDVIRLSRITEMDSSTNEDDVLIELYSPMSSACQEFALKFEMVVTKLQPFENIPVVCFDISVENVPKTCQEAGFDLKWMSLFLVRRGPFNVIPNERDMEANLIMDWIESMDTTIFEHTKRMVP